MDPVAFIPGMKVCHRNLASRWYVTSLAPYPPHDNNLHTKKYDTIVKGFRVLETSHEEYKKKLATAEERLSAVDAARARLIAEVEVGRQVLHDREMV